MPNSDVLIIGCGVSGLTCGILLAEGGFRARIVAKSVPPETTSNVAAALWYPYLAFPHDRVLNWCGRSYETFVRLSRLPESGVSLIEWHEVFIEEVPDPDWAQVVDGFRRLRPDELPPGYRDGYTATVPMIETPIYLPYLIERFTSLGGSIVKLEREIERIDEAVGPSYADAPIIVNCAGLGARELCNDQLLYPIRGQVLSLPNPGIARGIADELGPLSVAYVIPRSGDCILGGTATENDWNEEVDPETSADILRRCRELEPRLRDVEMSEAKVGLRPGRKEIRLERERSREGHCIIHNYGHGGAGFTLSWGCAEEVVALAREITTISDR